jgi:hypothetical protein
MVVIFIAAGVGVPIIIILLVVKKGRNKKDNYYGY